MSPIDVSVAVHLAVKACVLVGLGLYSVFAFIMIRQEQLMAAVLEEGFEPILRLLTVLHFAASIGLLILAILIL
ncbi:hypothetical protein HY949_00310 [Candidatus Gottesmanbacteria bacterium]|nr:hypothetical protein [Candidatus Gottesmanbacteria bacterium]